MDRIPDRRILVLCAAVAVLAFSSGCSAQQQYGNAARYAPSYRAYVLSSPSGADDPSQGEHAVVLRDPITQRKIRCREDLEKWAEAYRQATLDQVHDENWEIASILLMAPATMVAALGMDVAAVGVVLAQAPYEVARSESPESIYERGLEAFARDDWGAAARLMELAMVRSPAIANLRLARYYAGLSYANLGRSDEAREALTAFVEQTLVQEVTAYRNAERWLRYLDDPIPRCGSTKPMKIAW